MDLTGKTNHASFRAEYHPIGPALTSGNVFSCIEICDEPSCVDGCQKDHGEPGRVSLCSDSTLCYGPDVCENTTCDGSSVLDAPPVCLDDGCPFTFLDRDQPLDDNQVSAYPDLTLTGSEMMDQSLQCRWELPDVQCDVSLPSANALGQHIFQDHIEPLTTFVPWEQTNVLPQEKQPAEYLCQWGSCRLTFPDHAALERHVKVAHTNLDCRWAGCEVSRESPAQLKTHVNMDHLNIGQNMDWQSYPYGYKTSFEQPTYLGGDSNPADTQDSISGFDGSFQASASQHAVANPSSSPVGAYGNPHHRASSSSNAVHPPVVNRGQQISWSISPVVRSAPSSHSLSSSFSNLQGSSQAQLPSSAMASFKTSSGQNKHSHICQWLVDPALGQVCGANFADANVLQTHVNEKHITNFGADGIICNWQGCKRNRGPKPMFPNKEKLKRHMYTHTGCKCYPILFFDLTEAPWLCIIRMRECSIIIHSSLIIL